MAHLQHLPCLCGSPQPIPYVEISRFSTLHDLQMSAASWAEVATIVRDMEPGLRHLVVLTCLPQAESSLDTTALETIGDYCPRANIYLAYSLCGPNVFSFSFFLGNLMYICALMPLRIHNFALSVLPP